MKVRFLACVAATLGLLASCTTVSGPNANGVDVAFTGESAKSFVAGFQPTKVIVKRESDKLTATCKIVSSKFEATFQTPAIVNTPAYARDAVPATLTCTYGEKTKSISFIPENLSKKARTASAIGVAILCPICGVGVAAANSASNKEDDIYGFLEMEMEI